MRFDERKHFFRYQKLDRLDDIPVEIGNYSAWQKEGRKKLAVSNGDVVWVLKPDKQNSYRFLYCFIVNSEPYLSNGRWVMHGELGEIFEANVAVGNAEWFSEFFNKMGRGGIGIQLIDPEWVDRIIDWQRPKCFSLASVSNFFDGK